MQFHPEYNCHFIEELIINKMYDAGQLDDMQKNEAIDRIKNNELPLTKNLVN